MSGFIAGVIGSAVGATSTVPGAPGVAVTSTGYGASIVITAPSSNGGKPITQYVLTVTPSTIYGGGGTLLTSQTFTISSPGTQVVYALQRGVSWTASCYCTNSIGNSANTNYPWTQPSTGNAWGWGSNGDAQFGGSTAYNVSNPTQITTGGSFAQVSGGLDTMLIDSNGYLWGMGDNLAGELTPGSGTGTVKSTLGQIGSSSWSSISNGGGAGNGTVFGLQGTTLYGWGRSSQYQATGNGTTNSSIGLTQIPGSWITAMNGFETSYGIKADGSLWGWGYNSNGQLGQGNTNTYSTPVQMGAGYSWIAISAGTSNMSAIRSDGTLWACGSNANGQVGQGNTTNYSTLVQIGSLTGWTAISSPGSGVIGINNGNLYVWGSASYCGFTTNQLTPTQVGSGHSWLQATSGGMAVLALRNDGTIWAMGKEIYGNLGNGVTSGLGIVTSLIQVGSSNSWSQISASEYGFICMQ